MFRQLEGDEFSTNPRNASSLECSPNAGELTFMKAPLSLVDMRVIAHFGRRDEGGHLRRTRGRLIAAWRKWLCYPADSCAQSLQATHRLALISLAGTRLSSCGFRGLFFSN